MGWQSLICFALLALHGASAFSSAEHRSGSVGKTNYPDIESILVDAVEEELNSELSSMSDEEKEKILMGIKAAASQIREGYWLGDDAPFSMEEENDALHSRDNSNYNKREEYFDSLEQKSRRSTYAPRKTFYADSSIEEPRVRSSRSSRTADTEDYPDSEAFLDTAPSGSRHRVDSFVATPSEPAPKADHVQTPPWRQSSSYPRTAATTHQGKRFRPSMKSHGTYQMMSSVSKKPSASYVSQIRHSDGPKQRSESKQWVGEFQKPTAKMAQQDVKPRQGSVTGYGKMGTREQFHEQGVHGPHSYKFGYSTGDKENPMARYEERDKDGVVRGSYSYVDPTGKKQVVHYESHPKFGFSTNHDSNF